MNIEIDMTDQERIREYLLGLTLPDRAVELEQRLFTDSAFYEELLIVEDELIDQHLAGQLSDAEQRSFESHFLEAPERQEKLRFARSLRKYITLADANATEHAPEKSDDAIRAKAQPRKGPLFFWASINPGLAYAAAIAVLLLVVGVSFLILSRFKGAVPQPDNLLTVFLIPGGTREGGELKRLELPPEIGFVRLLLQLPDERYSRYSVRLETADGQTIYSRENLAAEVLDGKKVISVNLPAKTLQRGDFQVKLSGVNNEGHQEPIASYPFRVISR